MGGMVKRKREREGREGDRGKGGKPPGWRKESASNTSNELRQFLSPL
jgi:hypothetical protein